MADPLARELWVDDDIRSQATRTPKTPSQALNLSIVRVHEPIHAGLADRFAHFYGQPRALSFGKTIQLLDEGPHLQFNSFVRTVVHPMLFESWNIIQGSEWVQEAAAFRAQRNFLDQFIHPGRDSGWHTLRNRVGYHQLIEDVLEAGVASFNSSENPIPPSIANHAIGDWLGKRISNQDWEFDLLEVAFGLGRHTAGDEKIIYAVPNSVLAAAAQCSNREIQDLDARGQLRLLIDKVEGMTDKSYDVVLSDAISTEAVPSWVDDIDIVEWFDNWRDKNYQKAVTMGDWCYAPIYAPSSNSGISKTDSTLRELLDALMTDTVEQNGQLTRRLWLDSGFEWARGTPLLRMAISLWKLRDYTMIPLIRQYIDNTEFDINQPLATANAVVDGTQLPDPRLSAETLNEDHLMAWTRMLHDRTPELQERFEYLLNSLETLGRAIHHDDTDTIREFYSS